MTTKTDSLDVELKAVKAVYEALVNLDESGRAFVLKTVADRLGTTLPPIAKPADTALQKHSPPRGGDGTASNTAQSSAGNGQTVKQFIKLKRPASDVQRIACLAYYFTHNMAQPHFNTKEATKLNSDAGERDFSNTSMAIKNAINGYALLARAAGGNNRITNLGEALVDALPDQEAVKTVLSSNRKPNKRRSKKITGK